MKFRNASKKEKIELQMTPMIDIVFQLLIFFVMTFKIVAMEGDFNIRMPSASPSVNSLADELLPPMTLRLTAGPDGQLSGIRMNDRSFKNFDELHAWIRNLVGNDAGPDAGMIGGQVELDCDYNLAYEHVIAAITAVTGDTTEDGRIIKLIENIKFAAPRPSR